MAKAKKKVLTVADLDALRKTVTPQPSAKTLEKQQKELIKTTVAGIKARNKAVDKSIEEGPSKTPRGKNATKKSRDYLDRADLANRDIGRLGEKPKEKKAWYNKVIDVLSRGQYGAAEAVRRAGTLEDDKFWDFGAGVEGFKQGVTGKKKTSFSDVLKEHGNTGKGMGTLGFALDVFADPLTYTGVGLVSKAAKPSKAIAKSLEDTTDLVQRVDPAKRNITPEALTEGLGASKIPVRQVRRREVKKLSPQARALYESVKAEQKSTGTYKKVAGVSGTQHFGKKVKDSGKRTYIDTKAIPDEGLRKAVDDALKSEYAKSPGLHDRIRTIAAENNMGKDISLSNRYNKTIRFNAVRMGNRAGQEKWLAGKSAATHSTVPKTPEELARHIAIHEIGHHLGYALPKTERDHILKTVFENPDVAKLGVTDEKYISEALSEYGAANLEELLGEAWAEFRIMGAKARPLAKSLGNKLEDMAVKAPVDVQAKKLLEALADDTAKAAQREVDLKLGPGATFDEVEAGVKAMGAGKDQLLESFAKQSLDNISPNVKKQLALRIGGAQLPIPGVASAVGKTAEFIGSPQFVRSTVDTFNKTFRANAHIPAPLRAIRAKENSMGANLVRAYGHEIQSVFGPIKGAARKAMMKAWADGNVEGFTPIAGGKSLAGNVPVENAMQYFDQGMKDLSLAISRAQGEDLTKLDLGDLNSWLPDAFALSAGKTTTKTVNGQKVQVQKFDSDGFIDQIKQLAATGKINDPARALYMYTAAFNQAIAKRSLWDTIAKTHGVPKSNVRVDGDGRLGDVLQKTQNWREAKYGNVPIRGLEGQVFEPEIAQAIERMASVFSSSKGTGEFLRQYDRSLVTVKSILTRYNPSYHPRTFMGEMLLGLLGGMNPATYAQSYAKAGRIIHGRNREFMGEGFEADKAGKRAVGVSNTLQRLDPQDYAANGSKTVMKVRVGNETVNLNADTLWQYFMNSGLKSGFASTDLVRGVDSPVGGRAMATVSDRTQGVTEAVEDYGRLAHFVDVIRHSKAKTLEDKVQEAADVVRKTHLDYTEVTSFERAVAARFIPFYKWLRLSTPLMAEILLTQPGKAMVLPKGINAIARNAGYDPNEAVFPGGPDAAVPEYLINSGAQPVGSINGNTQWFNPMSLFPLAGSTELVEGLAGEDPMGGNKSRFANSLSAFMDIANPALTIGPELALDTQNKGAKPSVDYEKYFASQTPQTTFARKLGSDEDPSITTGEKVGKFIFNPGLISNTERTIQGAAYQKARKAELEKARLKREKGIK